MKKFLMISIVMILCAVLWSGINSRYSVYMDLNNGPVHEEAFRVAGKEIYRITQEGEELFEIRGINLESFIPGHFVTDFAVDEEQYIEWFGLIQEMGANTVRVPTIMDSGFYDALYKYNSKKTQQQGEPLYLLQALWTTDYAQDSHKDAWSDDFFGQLEADIKNAVDIIHGNEMLSYAKTRGSGWYTSDISGWVLGITVGTEWKGDTTAYTNHMREYSPYSGEYFSASKDASQFESMLAQLLDELVKYESVKYQTQHLVSVISEPITDPFDYEHLIDVQIGKCDRIDAEHILAGEEVQGGFFVSYKLYDFCSDILDYLTDDERQRLGNLLSGIPREGMYGGYLELLEAYYSVPVVIADCGFSTARGITKETGDGSGLTEKEQGEALVRLYQKCKSAGLSGMVISTWQDNWSRTNWNIYPMISKERAPLWHNVQSESQGYGLLAFEPGENVPKVMVDGDVSEWGDQEPLISNETGKIYCRQDEVYLYLRLDRADSARTGKIYIPIDVTEKSGSSRFLSESVKCSRAADFLLYLDGEDHAQILVQEYYDPWRAAWRSLIEHADAYTVAVPDSDSSKLIPMRMVLKDEPELAENWHEKNAPVFDTGLLCYGIADPKHPQYNSRADFYTAGNHTEIRIPWQLLNFSDPSDNIVHDDYYEHYGIQGQQISEIYLGLGSEKYSAQEIELEAVTLEKWGRDIVYHQRLKQSYFEVQKCWRNQ